MSVEDVAEAIRAMRVRGAPLIGVAAAYGLALAMQADATDAALSRAAAMLAATRPTAVNLAWAIRRMHTLLVVLDAVDRPDAAWREAGRIADEDVAVNRAIGEHGLMLLRDLHDTLQRPVNVLTHCNAGRFACMDWGTATAPIYLAHREGIPVHVYVEETRPRNQGWITAWELADAGVPFTAIVDNAGGHLMQHGKVDIVLVGADRVTRRGDVANKIGTYQKALAARDNKLPFYAAAPMSSIDLSITSGMDDVEIENRDAAEVQMVRGMDRDGRVIDARLLPPATPTANPGFDITPARLVTGVITERGIAKPAALARMVKK